MLAERHDRADILSGIDLSGATVTPLAQGEYNLNYLVSAHGAPKLVLRVNVGTQIDRADQIVYQVEKTLKENEAKFSEDDRRQVEKALRETREALERAQNRIRLHKQFH